MEQNFLQGMSRRTLVLIAAAALVVVGGAGVAVGLTLQDRNPVPVGTAGFVLPGEATPTTARTASASPTPTAVATLPSVTPSPSATTDQPADPAGGGTGDTGGADPGGSTNGGAEVVDPAPAPDPVQPVQNEQPAQPAPVEQPAVDPAPPAPAPVVVSGISADQARQIALAAAGAASDTYASVDYDDYEDDYGCAIYEVEFHSGGSEYDIDIDAATGEVLRFHREHDDD
ncbi:MAG: PepSY domain-containing protein [Propionibacteriaceae bacterium]|jgi:hypothetical protein|nr:PepSY domain-containing protein [Propionibacteriaceae bacterium]